MKKVAVLGASRGLGSALSGVASAAGCRVTGFSRKEPLLRGLQSRLANFDFHVADFASDSSQQKALALLLEGDFDKVFVVAGGGPYGLYHQIAFKSHEWAWQVSFQFPARVAHALLKAGEGVGRIPQLIFVGSAVAESGVDAKAASYCAAKHALKGLLLTLRYENPAADLRLFSPGYMDTEMLPKNAAVRQLGVHDPMDVAREMWTWSQMDDATGHRLCSLHPR